MLSLCVFSRLLANNDIKASGCEKVISMAICQHLRIFQGIDELHLSLVVYARAGRPHVHTELAACTIPSCSASTSFIVLQASLATSSSVLLVAVAVTVF